MAEVINPFSAAPPIEYRRCECAIGVERLAASLCPKQGWSVQPRNPAYLASGESRL